MFSTAHRTSAWPRTLLAALLGGVLGAAWQLQQPALWPLWVYALFVLLALVLYALAAPEKIAIRFRNPWVQGVAPALVLLAGMALGWGSTGARAVAFASTALAPALEGRDLRVTGVVEGLPQSTEAGLRFTLRVEQALLDETERSLPCAPKVMEVVSSSALRVTANHLLDLEGLADKGDVEDVRRALFDPGKPRRPSLNTWRFEIR